ncbi:MAG TPA: agmatinase family protein [Bacteroidetes bacterium]|nr:agmatinase family protein [Bacteroidota bacterium]
MTDITQFDPHAPGQTGAGIFGLPFTEADANIVLLPVPWEVTASYRGGTAAGPEAIVQASPQLDLFDEVYGEVWKRGIALAEVSGHIKALNQLMRPLGEQLLQFQEDGGAIEGNIIMEGILADVNDACGRMCSLVQEQSAALLAAGKKVVLIGGDHSTSLGYLAALAHKYGEFGILQIDAHMDLRPAYAGFTWSHASIMYNALQMQELTSLVQVGVRDFSREEYRLSEAEPRIHAFTGRKLAVARFAGKSWEETCKEIVEALPAKVYVSFDIDGLEPGLCPHTGTPVPGGLDFDAAMYLLDVVRESGRKFIGCDLVEVAPGPEGDEWDGNVGARIAYRLCGLLAD